MQHDHPHTYYRILGLDPAASPDDVKRAYRTLAKAWHPDRFTHDTHLQQQALEHMKDINRAYATLQALHRKAHVGSQDSAPRAQPRPPRWRRAGVWPWSVPTWLVALVAFVVLRLVADSIALTPPLRFVAFETAWPRTLPAQTRIVPPLFHAPSTPAERSVRPHDGQSPDRSRLSHFFTVGSRKDEVLAIQGRPTVISHRVWEYGGSRVYFHQDCVTRWEMWPRDPLRARLYPTMAVKSPRGYFTVGSSKDEVLALQGSPTRFTERVWEYHYSRVYFAGDRVTHWDEWPSSPLKARLAPLEEK